MSEISIIKYSKDKKTEWDTFVEQSNNGTLFHKIHFLEYHQHGRFNFHHLMFYLKNRLIAVLPAGLSDEGVLKSPMGASFGSFVTEDLPLAEHDLLVKRFISYCEDQNIQEVYLTPELEVYQKSLNGNIVYSLLYNGFEFSSHLFSSVLDLTTRQDDPLLFMKSRTRWSVRKSFKKNLLIKETDNFDEFYPILVENKRKFNVAPTHTLDELKDLKSRFSDDIRLFMAYRPDGFPIAGNVIFVCNTKSILLFYSAHLYEYKEFNAINRLLFNIIVWAMEQKYDYLDLGVSMNTASDNPMEPQWDLVFFKEGVGSKGALRNTLSLKL